MKNIILSTLPNEGQIVDWTTPAYYQPKTMRYMPLGILSLASNLDKGHEVVILDPASEDWSIQETLNVIERYNPDILGLSSVTRKVYALREILHRCKVKYKVVGGPHVTNYAQQTLGFGADAVMVGSFADLEFNAAVKSEPKGIIRCNTKINEIKYPERRFLDIDKYFPKTAVLFKANNRLPMFTSNGCPHKCVFCDVQNKKLEFKDPQKVVDEMQYLESLGCGSVHILDDNFNISEKHVNLIIDEMERRNFQIEWSGRGQASISEQMAKRLGQHNFKRIHVGIEALSDDVLKFLGKSLRRKEIERFCMLMNKNNIDMVAYFILGTPADTPEYLQKLPDMIKRMGIKYPYFNMLFPSPNTEYYNHLLRNKIYTTDYWREYMQDPKPNYRIPYPFGEEKYSEITDYASGLIRQFEKIGL